MTLQQLVAEVSPLVAVDSLTLDAAALQRRNALLERIAAELAATSLDDSHVDTLTQQLHAGAAEPRRLAVLRILVLVIDEYNASLSSDGHLSHVLAHAVSTLLHRELSVFSACKQLLVCLAQRLDATEFTQSAALAALSKMHDGANPEQRVRTWDAIISVLCARPTLIEYCCTQHEHAAGAQRLRALLLALVEQLRTESPLEELLNLNFVELCRPLGATPAGANFLSDTGLLTHFHERAAAFSALYLRVVLHVVVTSYVHAADHTLRPSPVDFVRTLCTMVADEERSVADRLDLLPALARIAAADADALAHVAGAADFFERTFVEPLDILESDASLVHINSVALFFVGERAPRDVLAALFTRCVHRATQQAQLAFARAGTSDAAARVRAAYYNLLLQFSRFAFGAAHIVANEALTATLLERGKEAEKQCLELKHAIVRQLLEHAPQRDEFQRYVNEGVYYAGANEAQVLVGQGEHL